MPTDSKPRFSLGRVFSTPGAVDALREAKEDPSHYLRRHHGGDWGEVCAEDKALNDEALQCGSRVLSAYTLTTKVKIWIITEADRSCTTILLPDEY